MVIIHNDREGFTNFDNVQMVNLSGRYIHVLMTDGNKRVIAVYDNPDRAAEVFAEMLMKLFPEEEEPMDADKIIPFINAMPDYDDEFFEDIHVFNLLPQWYYMPKE